MATNDIIIMENYDRKWISHSYRFNLFNSSLVITVVGAVQIVSQLCQLSKQPTTMCTHSPQTFVSSTCPAVTTDFNE